MDATNYEAERSVALGVLQDYAEGAWDKMRARLAPHFVWVHHPTPSYPEGLVGDAAALIEMYVPRKGGAFQMVEQEIEDVIGGPGVAVIRVVNRFRFGDRDGPLQEVRGALFFSIAGGSVERLETYYSAPAAVRS